MDKFTALLEHLGWQPRDPQLLKEALTHSTYANEHPEEGSDNERLEFLGDAVVNLLVAQILFLDHAAQEGELSRKRARVVSREGLAEIAKEMGLERYILLGQVQTPEMQCNDKILANAFEATMGAMFLDGGYNLVERLMSPIFRNALVAREAVVDYKTNLQEFCHRQHMSIPVYGVISESGPAHAKYYTCKVQIDDKVYGQGEGTSKKAAEQRCAQTALERFQVDF